MEGLGIVATSSGAESTEDGLEPKSKRKAKAKDAGRELIADAHLRLKGGVHYCLLGRNGTGKSSMAHRRDIGSFADTNTSALLRAMAEKLIPGIPHATRIAILQQTDEDNGPHGDASAKLDKSVLESVLGSDEARNGTVQMADCEHLFSPDEPAWLTRI